MYNARTLIFATNNNYKAEEIEALMNSEFKIITLSKAGINIDIPEPHETLEANASEKSKTIYKLTGQNCFGEDTGLEVDALDGKPGVKSARYAGEEKNFQANIDKLLQEMQNIKNRRAKFRTVISLIYDEEEHVFEGVSEGEIMTQQRGAGGFGYDSVFVPVGYYKTFAEMSLDDKNLISHRRRATEKLIQFLKQVNAAD